MPHVVWPALSVATTALISSGPYEGRASGYGVIVRCRSTSAIRPHVERVTPPEVRVLGGHAAKAVRGQEYIQVADQRAAGVQLLEVHLRVHPLQAGEQPRHSAQSHEPGSL